jgi:prepilin-type N-terminal cleavage/methylation domain-containing protein
MRRRVVPRGLSLLEVLVALVILGGGLHALLALHATTLRAEREARARRRLDLAAASVAESLGVVACGGTSGSRTLPEGRLAWVARHLPPIARFDLAVSPARGSGWVTEVVAPC